MEEQFWRGDADYYRSALAENAIMAFPPPAGILDRQATVESIAAAPRWSTVTIRDPHVTQLTPDSVLFTYTASARREADARDYEALATSAYVRHERSWLLAFHQQTPLQEG